MGNILKPKSAAYSFDMRPKSFIVYRFVRGEPLTLGAQRICAPGRNESFFWRSNPGVVDTKRQPRARFFGTQWNTFEVLASCKWLKRMVARDGIEPPTPAFSGLRSTN